MSIIRVSKDKNHPYVILNKSFLEDPKISLRLKGFLAYCLAKPNDWKFHIRQMAKVLKEGKDALYSIIDEGIENGYIEREIQKKNGRFHATNYVIYETKNQKNITVSGNPDATVTVMERATLLNTKVLNNKNNKREEASPTPSPSFLIHKRVRIDQEKYDNLVAEFGGKMILEMIERLDEYADINPKRFKQYACHGAVIRKWIRDDVAKMKKPKPESNRAHADPTGEPENRAWWNQNRSILHAYLREGIIYEGSNYVGFTDEKENIFKAEYSDQRFIEKVTECLKKLKIFV